MSVRKLLILSSLYLFGSVKMFAEFLWNAWKTSFFTYSLCSGWMHSILHMGSINQRGKYEMGGKELNSVEQERDLSVIIHQSGKSSAQCSVAAMKANQVLGMIKRNIKWKSMGVMVRLRKALVRPRIEYCVQAWNPNLEKRKR